jgi:hypothetical protein
MTRYRFAFRNMLVGAVCAWVGSIGVATGAVVPVVHADPDTPPEPSKVWSYLIGVTTRPGYNFANADAALSYGYGICDKVSQGRGYPEIMAEVENDINTSDDFQASFLVSEAVQELCPALIPQLRSSAAHYRPLPGTTP